MVTIRTRLVAASVTIAFGTGAGFLFWAGQQEQAAAVAQAQDFATSVHQMTLAGLTAMMITGNADDRGLFLDQIEQSNHVRSLRVIRSEAVSGVFGKGRPGESDGDAADLEVLRTGVPYYEVKPSPEAPMLRAVLPAVASSRYLGKNCLSCHDVPEGTVLGAVSMEISLARANAAVQEFNQRAALTAMLLLLPFSLLIWYAAGRLVTQPIDGLTRGLRRIAEGDVAATRALPTREGDEIGQAAQAFNSVMDKVGDLLHSLRLSRAVFDNAMEAILVTDPTGRIRMVNRSFEITTGYDAADVIGRTPAVLKSGIHDHEFYQAFWDRLTEDGDWSGEIWNRRKDGSIYAEWLNIVSVKGPSGTVENYIGIFTDVTERKRREEEVTFHAYHDSLTGLPNRVSLTTRLEQAVALAGRHGHPAPSVMYIDLDRLKWVNDTLGHLMGDRVLVEAAARLKASVRESDTVARIGGDEFIVLLPETSDEVSLRHVARKVMEAFEAPMRLGHQRVKIGASIGVARYPDDGSDAEALLARADEAMYRVKEAARPQPRGAPGGG